MDPEKLHDHNKTLNIRGLTADRLRTIYYVAATQSATKAAEKLHICQSAVTKQIQQIEDEVGFLIYHRRDRKFIPTAAGEKLIQLAERTLHDIDGTLKSLKELYEGMGGKLIIRTSPSMANTWLPHYLEGFDELYPEIEVVIQSTLEDIRLIEDADVMIRTYVPQHDQLCQLKLFDNVMGLYASTKYIQKHGVPQSLEDLDAHKLLAIDRSLEKNFDYVNWILKVGIQDKHNYRKPAMELPSNDAMANAMIVGLGIASLGTQHIKFLGEGISIERVLPHLQSEPLGMYFGYNKGVTHTHKYMALYDFLVQKITRDKDYYT